MINVHFIADGQNLSVENVPEIASDLVNKVSCSFSFNGEEWENYDIVKAVFWNKASDVIKELLIVDNGEIIPWELLADKGKVYCNLIGCTVSTDKDEKPILVERFTTYKCLCVNVKQDVVLDGELPTPPTPTVFEQFAANYANDYEKLQHLPSIEGVELRGNKTFAELGMEECSNIDIDSLFKNIFKEV